MKERSFDEMIAYFNRRVADMDISQDSKMELLGMATALGFKHEKSAQRWIPCSERLPEDGLYLVTTSKGQVQVHVFSHNGNSEEYWMRCNKAWMPLPEPYKGGTSMTKNEIVDIAKVTMAMAEKADMVAVTRCKDCRWWDKYGDYDNGYCMAAKHGYWSEHWDISIRRTYKGDFYCADAEPKREQE